MINTARGLLAIPPVGGGSVLHSPPHSVSVSPPPNPHAALWWRGELYGEKTLPTEPGGPRAIKNGSSPPTLLRVCAARC